MGTRGFLGFIIDGEVKISYNHFDSYPSALGLSTLNWLRTASRDRDGLMAQARNLRVVASDSVPTAQDIEQLSRFSWSAAEHGGDQDLRTGQEWYDLLHETQGSLARILEAGVIEDASSFTTGSLFAEYGYVADLDGQRFEAYEGFQKLAHDNGRFAAPSPDRHGYYPVRLVNAWPLDDLPSDDEFEAAFGEDAEE
jgi:hypothetical protein